MIKALIFDVDGVLIDSVKFHFNSWKKAFKHKGITLKYIDYIQKLNGVPREQGIKNVIPDVTHQELLELFELKQHYLLDLLKTQDIKIIPGAKTTLKKLKQKYILAAASSSKNARIFLEKADLESFFTTIVTGYDIQKSKPDPEIFLLAATRIGVDPQHCLVIEDAKTGIEAAHNGGMRAIGFSRSKDPELSRITEHLISKFSELIAVTQSME